VRPYLSTDVGDNFCASIVEGHAESTVRQIVCNDTIDFNPFLFLRHFFLAFKIVVTVVPVILITHFSPLCLAFLNKSKT